MEGRSGSRRSSSEQLGPGGDRVSALPDDLLLLILARLECVAAAARTGILSGRWRGLWVRLRRIVLRDLPFHSLKPALASVSRPPPTVSLLEIRLPEPHGHVAKEQLVDTARLSSLLHAAVQLEPEEIIMVFPAGIIECSSVVHLPGFHRATSMVLGVHSPRAFTECYRNKPTIHRVPTGVDFPVLEALSLSGCTADLDTLLPRCPRLRKLRLADVWFNEGNLGINSPLLQELVVADGNWIYHVNIVAPMLKQLTMSIHLYGEVSISILAPLVEKVLWDCSISGSTKYGFWRVAKLSLTTAERHGQLPSLHIHAYIKLSTFYEEGELFTQEIEKHIIADFSVLELHLTTKGHAFGAFVFHLLGMNRIRCAIQRLKVHIETSEMKEMPCLSHCHCDSPNWGSQTTSLISLKEVEINGFEGAKHEFDLLKLVLRCAPILRRVNIKLSHEASTNNVRCCNTVASSPFVDYYIYHSSGEYIIIILLDVIEIPLFVLVGLVETYCQAFIGILLIKLLIFVHLLKLWF